MAMVRNTNALKASDRRASPRLTRDIAELLRSLTRAFSNTYRPEQHYMRGPGPKWHAKHAPADARDQRVPALVRAEA